MSEKDAHLAWLEATSEGNIHTRSTIDRLRKERRDLLLRMKEEVRHAEFYVCPGPVALNNFISE